MIHCLGFFIAKIDRSKGEEGIRGEEKMFEIHP